jgi:hypothetical protein
MTFNRASISELENLSSDVKGKAQVVDAIRPNTDALIRGGLARSSNEVLVMRMERRGKRIKGTNWSTGKPGGTGGKPII